MKKKERECQTNVWNSTPMRYVHIIYTVKLPESEGILLVNIFLLFETEINSFNLNINYYLLIISN